MEELSHERVNALFVQATQPHWDSLLRFAASLTNNKIEAEDILQNALIKALRFFPRFLKNNFYVTSEVEVSVTLSTPETQAHIKNWLYKITKNTFLDAFANKSLSKVSQWDELEDELVTDHQGSAADTSVLRKGATVHPLPQHSLGTEEEFFYALALDDQWKEKLTKLTSKQRSVLYLAAESYSYKEIASILDIPMGTVMSSLARASEKLRRRQPGE